MSKLLYCFVFCFSLMTYGQTPPFKTTHLIQYRVTYSLDTARHGFRQNEELYLYSGKQCSVFTNYNRLKEIQKREELQQKHPTKTLNIHFDHNSTNLSFNKVFYKNLNTHSVLTLAHLQDSAYFYPEPQQLKWSITDEKRNFYGYTTQKATTHYAGRDYVAWYTTEIPFKDGPYNFCGLPGLIVKLYDTDNDYHFKFQSIQKTPDTLTWTIKQPVQAISKVGFVKKQNLYLHNRTDNASLIYMLQQLPQVSGSIRKTKQDTLINLTYKGDSISETELRKLFKIHTQSNTNYLERVTQD